MRILLEENLAPCTSLDAVLAQTQQTLAELHHEDGLLIHYVAGPISCDGDEHIPANLRLLEDTRTDVMRTLPKGSIAFTAPFIFTPDVYSRLELFAMERTEREAAMQDFWDTLILPA